MEHHDVCLVNLSGVGAGFQISPAGTEEVSEDFGFYVGGRTTALILAVLDPVEGLVEAPPDVTLELWGPRDRAYRSPVDSDASYVRAHDGKTSLAILNDPEPGQWRMTLSHGGSPFEAHLLLLSANQTGGPSSNRPRCRLCKSATKALALGIVAAATLPAIPQALILAVAKYLTCAIPVASAVINALMGDLAETIAEKLCEKISLC